MKGGDSTNQNVLTLIDGILIGVGFSLIFFGMDYYIWLPQNLTSFPGFWNTVQLPILTQLISSFKQIGLILLAVGTIFAVSGSTREAYYARKTKTTRES